MPNKSNPSGDDHGLPALEESKTQCELRSRDDLLQKLSEQVPGVIYQYQQWPDGRSCFPYASIGIREIYEVTPEEVRKSAETVFRRLHPEDIDRVAASIRHSQETMERWSCEYRVCLPQRGIRWLDGQSVPERLPDGSTIWHGNIRDVTERKLAEEALQLKDTAIATSINAIAIADVEGRLSYVNRSFLHMWGYESDNEVLCRLPQEFFEQPDLVNEAIQNTFINGSWLGELRGVRRDGSSFDAQVSANLILNHQGQPTNLLASFIDITDRKLAEAEVLKSRDSAERALDQLRIESARAEQFYRLCELAGQRIGIARLEGTLTYMNPAFRRLLEIPEDADLKGLTFWEFVPAEQHQFLSETVLASARETGFWSGEIDLLTTTGNRVPIINTVFLLRSPDGTVQGYSNIVTDITELKHTEQALRESETRQRLALDAAQMGTWEWDVGSEKFTSDAREQALFGFALANSTVRSNHSSVASTPKTLPPSARYSMKQLMEQALT